MMMRYDVTDWWMLVLINGHSVIQFFCFQSLFLVLRFFCYYESPSFCRELTERTLLVNVRLFIQNLWYNFTLTIVKNCSLLAFRTPQESNVNESRWLRNIIWSFCLDFTSRKDTPIDTICPGRKIPGLIPLILLELRIWLVRATYFMNNSILVMPISL